MVKNTGGGGNAKKQGRKFQNNNKSDELRQSQDKNELYAIVDKIYGNGLNVYTCLGQSIWCRIPGRFKGRNKRNNYIEVGSWVLVGIYEWENEKEPKSCELMEVYDRNDIEQLRNLPGTNLKLLNIKMNENQSQYEDANNNNNHIDDDGDDRNGFVFTESVVDAKTMFAEDVTAVVSFANDEEINIDDL
jgi:hypothetical protein